MRPSRPGPRDVACRKAARDGTEPIRVLDSVVVTHPLAGGVPYDHPRPLAMKERLPNPT